MTYVLAAGRAFSNRIWIRPVFEFQPLFACFVILLGFVAVVSVHDAALLVVNQGNILDFEKNPIGYWLIQANSGSVWLFVVVKLLGTSLVCAVLASIYEYSRRLALVVTSPLAVFQAMLLSFLYWN